MLNNDPDWDPTLFAGERRLYYGRWTYKYESAARQGAAGAIIIHTTPSAGYPLPGRADARGPASSSSSLPATNRASRSQAWITEEAAERLVALWRAGSRRAVVTRARSATSRRCRSACAPPSRSRTRPATVRDRERRWPAAGADPVLANEVVVYTAHHDHLGIGDRRRGGRRRSTTARSTTPRVAPSCSPSRERSPRCRAAAAFDPLPLRRRRGAGPARLASTTPTNPTFPPGRIAANINLDSANIWGRTRDVTYIGFGKSSLDAVVDRRRSGAGTSRQGRPGAREGLLLPLGPVQLRADRRAGDLSRSGDRVRRPGATAAKEPSGAPTTRPATTSRATR